MSRRQAYNPGIGLKMSIHVGIVAEGIVSEADCKRAVVKWPTRCLAGVYRCDESFATIDQAERRGWARHARNPVVLNETAEPPVCNPFGKKFMESRRCEGVLLTTVKTDKKPDGPVRKPSVSVSPRCHSDGIGRHGFPGSMSVISRAGGSIFHFDLRSVDRIIQFERGISPQA